MELYSKLMEYYDELFPLQEKSVSFCEGLREKILTSQNNRICKVLDVGCCTATIDHALVKHNFDVTGIDSNSEMIEVADRRKKVPFTNSRFYEMPMQEMFKFLKKGTYDLILSLGNICVQLTTRELVKSFFCDIKQMLVSNGVFLIQLVNYEKFLKRKIYDLPVHQSSRVVYAPKLAKRDDNLLDYTGYLSFPDSNKEPVSVKIPIYPLQKSEIEKIAVEVGFKHIEFYANFALEPFSDDRDYVLGVLSL